MGVVVVRDEEARGVCRFSTDIWDSSAEPVPNIATLSARLIRLDDCIPLSDRCSGIRISTMLELKVHT